MTSLFTRNNKPSLLGASKFDDEDEDVWDLETDEVESYPHTIPGKASVQIRPLAEAALPRVCYLVIDRDFPIGLGKRANACLTDPRDSC